MSLCHPHLSSPSSLLLHLSAPGDLGTLICWDDDLIGGVLVSTAVGGRGSDLTLCVQVSPCQMVWANGIVKRTSMESLNQRNQCELMEQV